MRVAVTGADGFTGRYVVAALRQRGAEVVELCADLTDVAAIDDEVSKAGFDCLIHLAAVAFVGNSDWRSFYNVNQIGTYSVLEAVSKYHPGTRCILASSAQVYGPHASGVVSEHAAANPGNPYALSKYAMELGSVQWSDRLSISIVRPFNYTGVGQEPQYLIPKIIEHFRKRAQVIALGNINVARDFGDVRSAAAAYVGLALDCDADVLVNLCSGQTTRLLDVIEMVSDLTGHRIAIEVNPAFVRANDVPTLGGDATYLRRLLPSWQPIALRQTLQWMLED